MGEVISNQQPFPWFRAFIISYGICIVLSLAGVVLGAINFVAGPVHYPGYVLVLWLLTDILFFVAVAFHLTYYGIELKRKGHEEDLVAYGFLAVCLVIGGGTALLITKHFGWFSACTLAALIVCGVIDVVLGRK